MSAELEGIYYGMNYESYAAVPALRGSDIIHMRRSPMKFNYERNNPSLPSPALTLGTKVHTAILEPETIGEIAIWGAEEDQKVRRGKVWEQFQLDNCDKEIMTVEEYETVTGIAAVALENPLIAKYARAVGPTEVSMFWRHPVTGRRFKARIDKLIPPPPMQEAVRRQIIKHDRVEVVTPPPAKPIIFDLKTTRDCTSYRFGAQAYALGYHIKMALYATGYEVLTGIRPEVRLGAIESKPPYESAVYRVVEDVLVQGGEELGFLVEKLTECEKSGKWPAEQDQESDLLLPTWVTTDNYELGDV